MNYNFHNIKDIVLAVTYRCNSRCVMCNIWQKTDHTGELKPNDFFNLPKNLRDINISGGEPFLRPDISKIIKTIRLRCKKARIIISSNGFATGLILEKIEKILAIDKNIGVALSLDGLGEAHNNIRRIPDGYNKVMHTLEGLKKLGVKNLRLGFTLGDYNILELKKVYTLAREKKIEMSLAVVHSSENFFSIENKIEKKDAMIKELEWLKKQELKMIKPKHSARAYFIHGMIEFLKTGQRILPDYSGRLSAFVDPHGQIYACDIATEVLGNLKNSPATLPSAVCKPNWMICTARPAIKKHWGKALFWILKQKISLKKRYF